ncbi:alkane hydroxylase MAH1-like [Humulus lupulus]|uniref:alkane hydroxylase MAH1-like n=1 Tax=Humulus lupulus TaxID=3486 RepID=UPI002B40A58D|nr:alkane hydroxylase MAH1-like [Humulus lupulus]
MALEIRFAEMLAVAMVLLIICFFSAIGRPVFGMWPKLLRNVPRLHDYATEFLRQHDLTIEFKGPWFANLDFIITCDPRNIQHILITNFANYPKGPEFKEAFEALGDGILNVDSDLWRLQRKMFQSWSRQHRKFDSFVARTIQQKVVNDLIPFLDRVSDTKTQVMLFIYYITILVICIITNVFFLVDLQEAFQCMVTFESAMLLIFGLDPDHHSFKFSKVEYQKAFDDIQEATLCRHFLPESWWKLQRWLQVGYERKLTKARGVFDEFMYQCISIKRKDLYQSCESQNKEQFVNSNDLMTLYMEEKEKPYSDQFLKDVALNFVAAARDTLTAGLSWFFYLVATHPTIEAKILEEMKENLPTVDDDHDDNKHRFFDVEELSKLVYLQATLYETLRLYPSVPLNHKTVAEPDILPSGHRVERKTRVLMSYYAMGRMEKIWGKDCLEFKPERWISEQGGFVYIPSHKYTVFNAGPRSCLGKDMALIQMKVLATAILRNFSLQVVEGHPVSPKTTVTLHMKHGLKVWVFKRSA